MLYAQRQLSSFMTTVSFCLGADKAETSASWRCTNGLRNQAKRHAEVLPHLLGMCLSVRMYVFPMNNHEHFRVLSPHMKPSIAISSTETSALRVVPAQILRSNTRKSCRASIQPFVLHTDIVRLSNGGSQL